MFLEESSIYTAMEPRLQRALDRYRRGMRTMATAASTSEEIGVVALVNDLDAWRGRSEIKEGATIGEIERGSLVTARVPLDQLETIRQAPEVESLKAAQPLRPMLSATVEEIRGVPADLPGDSSGGARTIVGVVDLGCDFAHRNFLRTDGSTRLLGIWDQASQGSGDSPFGYGRLFGPEEIDAALASDDPYGSLGYPANVDEEWQEGTHGTHVMDIAAGNGRGSGTAGVAPEAELLFVEPATSDIAWQGAEAVGVEFGDSVQLLEALVFIFQQAGDRPCAINVSLGTHGGPHDGSSLVEQGIDELVRQAPNRAVVIAAANSYGDGIHAAGSVSEGESVDLQWEIPQTLQGESELEVWYSGSDTFDAELIAPDGNSVGRVPPGSSGRIQDDSGNTLLFVSHRTADPNNGDNTLGVFVEQVVGGTWAIRLHGASVVDGAFHAWIERGFQSNFAAPRDDSHTLGSISCGQLSIVVGSYDAHDDAKPISSFSSAGPTRDGRDKPEVSAPGHDVVAARSTTGTDVTTMSGTSMAAPAVTGMAALLLSDAAARGESLDIDTLRRVILETARSDPPAEGGWNDRYGNGRIDVTAALEVVGSQPADIASQSGG